jgi:hypothetical protein
VVKIIETKSKYISAENSNYIAIVPENKSARLLFKAITLDLYNR